MAYGRHLESRNSPYFTEKSSHIHEIWYTTGDLEPDDSHVTKYMNF